MFINLKTINQKSSIKKVLKFLNASKLKIVILVDKKNKVKGVITDGDIRRILLKNNNINQSIEKFVNKKFIYSKNLKDENILKKTVLKFTIPAIPILNKNNTLKTVYHDEIKQVERKENEVFILAGGYGKRLFPLTSNRPKPMLRVGNAPLLESIIYNLKESGFYRINLSVNFLQEKIIEYFGNGEKFGVRIKYIKERKPLGTGGSLSLLKNNFNKPIIVLNGDLYTNLNFSALLEYHKKNKNDLTVCSKKIDKEIEYGVISKNKDDLIKEKPIHSYNIFAGILIINQSLIKKIDKNKFIKMTDIINKFSKKNYKIGIFPIHELWFDIGNYQTLFNVNNGVNV